MSRRKTVTFGLSILHSVEKSWPNALAMCRGRLADTFTAFQNGTLEDVKGFCATVKTEDIAKQDYILTPGRYVGIEEKAEDDEPFDEKMKRLTSELGQMFTKSHELEEQIKKNLEGVGWKI